MTDSANNRRHEIGRSARAALVLFAAIAPPGARNAMIGDLLEESRDFPDSPSGQRQARRWLWGQLLRSAPALLLTPWPRAGWSPRGWRLLAGFGALAAVAQAWDSGVFAERAIVIALVVAAIVLPFFAAAFSLSPPAIVLSFTIAVPMLVLARAIAERSLSELLLALLPFVPILVIDRIGREAAKTLEPARRR